MRANINVLMYSWDVRNVFSGITYCQCHYREGFLQDDFLITLKLMSL
jgi:hypothetical protein